MVCPSSLLYYGNWKIQFGRDFHEISLFYLTYSSNDFEVNKHSLVHRPEICCEVFLLCENIYIYTCWYLTTFLERIILEKWLQEKSLTDTTFRNMSFPALPHPDPEINRSQNWSKYVMINFFSQSVLYLGMTKDHNGCPIIHSRQTLHSLCYCLFGLQKYSNFSCSQFSPCSD